MRLRSQSARTLLYEEVVEELYRLIDEKHIQPGGKLPPERELIEQLKVSRNVLREAFHVLETRGVIVSHQGKGRFLREQPGHGSEKRTESLSKNLERYSMLEAYEVRQVLEVKGVELIIRNASEEDIDDLEKETFALSDDSDYRHAVEYGEPQIKKKLKAFNQKIIHENKEYAKYVIRNKIDALSKTAQEERQHILNLQNEINRFVDNIQSNQNILEKSAKASAIGKISGYVVIALFLLMFLPWTLGFWADGDTVNGIFCIVFMVVLYKFVVN